MNFLLDKKGREKRCTYPEGISNIFSKTLKIEVFPSLRYNTPPPFVRKPLRNWRLFVNWFGDEGKNSTTTGSVLQPKPYQTYTGRKQTWIPLTTRFHKNTYRGSRQIILEQEQHSFQVFVLNIFFCVPSSLHFVCAYVTHLHLRTRWMYLEKCIENQNWTK